MNLKVSPSNPELLVGDSGEVYVRETGKRLNLIRDHGYSTNGPVVIYKTNRIHRNLSVSRLVYEAHVKGSKLTAMDYFEHKDADDNNVSASNLVTVSFRRNRKKPQKVNRLPEGEKYSTWMNGHSELYC